MGIDVVPNSFDPVKVYASNAAPPVLSMLYDQLLQLDGDDQPAPMLATSWEFSDDGTTLTMELRDDAVFNGSGAKVDAEAVKANLDRAKTSPDSLVATSLTSLTSVSVVDDTTVEMEFDAPAYAFPSTLAYDERISSIVDPEYLDDPDLGTQPHGSGPFVLESATQTKIEMTRVADHWDSSSGLAKKVEVIAIPDANARLSGLQAGQLDVNIILPDQYGAAEKLADTGKFQTLYGKMGQKYAIRINPERVPDPTVRKAISLALDRDAFCDSQFPDMGRQTQQELVETNPGYDASLDEALAPDVEGAKALLEQAGESGRHLSIVAASSSQGRMEILQQQLAAAGITVDINTQATPAAVTADYKAGKYDASLGAVFGTVDPATIVEQSIAAGTGFGIPDYLVDAVAAANEAPPGEARSEAWGEVNQILVDKPYDVPLCDIRFGLIGSNDVIGMSSVRYIDFGPLYEARRLGLAK